MPWNDNLEGKALIIAQTTATTLRVLAGPGTGKSYAMMRRVARLLEDQHLPAERILAVTFTRNAAADLQREVAKLGIVGCDKVAAGTLHAFCFRLLQQNAVLQQTGRHPRPLLSFLDKKVMQFEAKPMLADLDLAYGDLRAKSKRVLAFEAAWARRQWDTPGHAIAAGDQQFHADLLQWLKFHRAMILGELIPEAPKYLEANPAAPARHAHDHVVVDEFQDLNRAEQDLIDLLVGGGALSIVGDEDQSIYRFRHANPDGIRDFHLSHSSTQDETLDECRRCPKLIVQLADQLIRRNYPAAAPPRLLPMPSQKAGVVHRIQWKDLDAEIAGIAAFVGELVTNRGVKPRDILILSPRKYIGYGLRDNLVKMGVVAHSFYNEEVLDSDEAQQAFTLLTLLADPDDRVAYRFWLGCKHVRHHRDQYAKLREFAETKGLAPRDAMTEILAGTTVSGVTTIRKRHQELDAALSPLVGLKGQALVDAVLEPGQAWSEPLRAIWESVSESLDDPDAEARVVVDALRGHIAHPEVPDTDAVRIMSLHKSKGLTAKIVIVTSCVQGLIPVLAFDAAEANEVEREQRRLFYVALTRATDMLVLSSCRGVKRALAHKLGLQLHGYGPTATFTSSQFLSELGPQTPTAKKGEDWAAGGYV